MAHEPPDHLHVRVSPAVRAQIRRAAAQETLRSDRTVTLSDWIRQAIQDRLEKDGTNR